MKMNKRIILVVSIVAIVVSYFGIFFGFKAISNYIDQKICNQLIEAFDNADQDMAIKQLSELRGRILEIETLCHEDIPRSVLLDALEDIITPKHFTNPYLKDFTFVMPNTSDVGEICKEFISQIDDQIHIIKYEVKDE